MREWEVEITTHPGLIDADTAIAAISVRLSADARALGPAVTWVRGVGAVKIAFHVEADDYVGAMIHAAGAMTTAVGRPDQAAELHVRPIPASS
jgi:hypothetical protein